MRDPERQRTHQHHRTGELIVKSIVQTWKTLLQARPRWIATVVLIPSLYGLGWMLTQPLLLVLPDTTAARLSLIGTALSLVLFVVILPSWVRQRWSSRQPWRVLGLRSRRQGPSSGRCLMTGLVQSVGLLTLISLPLIFGSWGRWLGELNAADALNALALCFGVGLAEELLFRGWLWGELAQFTGPRTAVVTQAVIFSLVHTRFNLGVLPMLGLLVGLTLLGLVLAVQRRLNDGSLWGCVGLHGGLVGGWFALQGGLLQISPGAPQWLIGPGGAHPNPLGGLVGIAALTVVLGLQLTALAKAPRP